MAEDVRVRPLTLDDIEAVQRVQVRGMQGIEPWRKEELAAQIARFPEGQIGVEIDGRLVATSSSLLVDGDTWEERHTFAQVCDEGKIGNHDPDGDTLYGIDIVVDPEFRGLRLARRLYEARKQICLDLNLERMFIAGRIPGYRERSATMSAREYVRRVLKKELEDRVVNAQVANGFSVLRVLADYLPEDTDSRGYAVLMQWLNPDYVPPDRTNTPSRVRVAAAQYRMRPVRSFEDFASQCDFFADTASEYRCDFLVFPELLTTQLMGLLPPGPPGQMARGLASFTERYVELFSRYALRHAVNIVAGSHMTVEGDQLYNVGYLFKRDGGVERQRKIHITPSELRWWGVTPGRSVEAFDTDCGKVSILICYDVEFPELGRIARSKGAGLFFVPYNTDIRSGHLRVRTCAQARCIENHVYAVTCGAVGNLPHVDNADIHYAQSAVLTPSDIPFARDGIATEATPGVEAMLVHDLDMAVLRRTLRTGTVRPWLDRRTDMYGVVYEGPDGPVRI